jgi:hypothetical protein
MSQRNIKPYKQVIFLRTSSLLILGLFLCGIILPTVSANAPSNMTVSYNLETQELMVNITHPVVDTLNHYISQVTIEKNNIVTNTTTYTTQPQTDSFTYTYLVNASIGDTLVVTTSCIQGGSKTIEHTIDANNGGTKTSTPGFEIIILLGAILISLIIVRRKKFYS